MSRHIHYKHPYRLVSCVFFPSSFHSVWTQSNGVEYAIVIKTYLVQSFHYFWMSRFEFFVRSIMVIRWRLARKFTPLRNNNRLSRIFHMWNGKKKIIIVFKCAVALVGVTIDAHQLNDCDENVCLNSTLIGVRTVFVCGCVSVCLNNLVSSNTYFGENTYFRVNPSSDRIYAL